MRRSASDVGAWPWTRRRARLGAGVYVGFLAGVCAHNPDRIDALIARMFPLPQEHQWAIVRAVAYSGLPDWRTVLQRNAARMPARRVMIERFLAGKLPTLKSLSAIEPRDVRAFMASRRADGIGSRSLMRCS